MYTLFLNKHSSVGQKHFDELVERTTKVDVEG